MQLGHSTILTLDADGLVQAVGGQSAAHFGFTDRELIGRSVECLYPSGLHWSFDQARAETSAQQTVRVTKTGQPLPVTVRTSPLYGVGDEVIGFVEILIPGDISPVHSVEASRTDEPTKPQDSELLIENAPYPVFLIDEAGAIAHLNSAARRVLGYQEGELEGRPVQVLVPPSSRGMHAQHVAGFLKAPSWRFMGAGRELFACRRDGQEFPAQIALGTVHSRNRRYVVATVVDLTAQRANERLLQNKELRLRQMSESLPQLIFSCTEDGQCDYVSPQWVSYTGVRAEDQLGAGWLETVHAVDRALLSSSWRTALSSGKPFHIEFRIRRLDGVYRWFDARSAPLSNSEGVITKWFSSHTDIEEPRAVRERLRAMQTQLTNALEAGRMGAWVRRLGVHDVWMDDALLRVFGRTREEIRAQPTGLVAFVHPDDREHVEAEMQRLFAGGLFASMEFRATRGDGGPVWLAFRCRTEFDDQLRVVAVAGVTWDVTREKHDQEAQLRSQKLEALGTLASGIAHDFNNLLQAIIGNAQLALLPLSATHPSRENLDQLLLACTRGAELVRGILTFSRPDDQRREVVQLPSIVREALKLLRATLSSSVALQASYQDRVPAIMASPTQLHQIVVNLVTNAAHAVEGSAGSITLSTEEVFIGDDDVAGTKQGMTAGRYALLMVRDNGVGMHESVRTRIFDPFFTTKPVGRGTGLGLSVVHGIVRSLGGTIEVSSEPGRGTTFRLYFPEYVLPIVQPAAEDIAPQTGRGAHVLYVDDDPILVALGTKILEALGYAVTGCDGPEEALAVFSKHPQQFDAVLSDVTMPTLSGFELARRLLRIREDVPVLVMSGFVGPEQRALTKEVGAREILVKPVPMTEFARALARHVSGGAAGSSMSAS